MSCDVKPTTCLFLYMYLFVNPNSKCAGVSNHLSFLPLSTLLRRVFPETRSMAFLRWNFSADAVIECDHVLISKFKMRDCECSLQQVVGTTPKWKGEGGEGSETTYFVIFLYTTCVLLPIPVPTNVLNKKQT